MNRVNRDRIGAFLDEIEAVQRKHGISISHEDGQGAFILVPFSEGMLLWLRTARLEGETAHEWMERFARATPPAVEVDPGPERGKGPPEDMVAT